MPEVTRTAYGDAAAWSAPAVQPAPVTVRSVAVRDAIFPADAPAIAGMSTSCKEKVVVVGAAGVPAVTDTDMAPTGTVLTVCADKVVTAAIADSKTRPRPRDAPKRDARFETDVFMGRGD